MRVLLLTGYLLIAGLLSYAAGMWLHDVANAHLADRPDLNKWAMGLKAASGAPCCDGSEAEPIKDVDWDATNDGRYRVRIDGEWVDVPPNAIVPGPNKYGMTLVWGYRANITDTGKYTFVVRCFMPAGGV
jgi:hypothetical protein